MILTLECGIEETDGRKGYRSVNEISSHFLEANQIISLYFFQGSGRILSGRFYFEGKYLNSKS